MADVSLHTTYVIEFSDEDLRLVELALSGRLKSTRDFLAMKELNISLLQAQQICLEEKTNHIKGALARANEKEEPES